MENDIYPKRYLYVPILIGNTIDGKFDSFLAILWTVF
jgi:hypothetical protein